MFSIDAAAHFSYSNAYAQPRHLLISSHR